MSARYLSRILLAIFLFGFLSACGIARTSTVSTATPVLTTDSPQATIRETPIPSPAVTQATPSPTPTQSQEPTPSPEPYTLPLTNYGPNFIGKRVYSFEDYSRENRQVGITVWYPALKPKDFTGTSLKDAEPDASGAPYPIILSSTKVANLFAPHLVTHGFAVVSVNKQDSYYKFDNTMIDMPLDLLFALNQAGSSSFEGLDGILDAERAGMMGYSFGGYNSLAMSGAQVDPEHYLTKCAEPTTIEEVIYPGFIKYQCALVDKWNEFATHAGEELTVSDDGLWQPMTDERIRAVMPLAGEGWLLFGKQGLKVVDRPVFIIVGTMDEYYQENLLIFENLGTPDRFLISFVGQPHIMIYNSKMVDRMKHFVVAFFGYYLQEHQEYAEYFSEDFVSQYHDLSWGK